MLDALLEAIIDAGAPNGAEARSARDQFAGGPGEAELAGRCVTMAALALRRAVGNENDPRPIVDGDSAFNEYQPASGLPVGPDQEAIKKSAVSALDLAVERLGPLPGGRLGRCAHPTRRWIAPARIDVSWSRAPSHQLQALRAVSSIDPRAKREEHGRQIEHQPVGIPRMDEDSDTLDLAFSRWSSPAVVATLAGVLGC